MKKVLFIFVIIVQSTILLSQNTNQYLSFQLRYPIPTGNNYINRGFDKGYTGIIDAGVDYNFFRTGNLGIGLQLNTSFLRLTEGDVNLMILSPKVKVEYQIKSDKINIVPNIAIGYSRWGFRSEMMLTDVNGAPMGKQTFKENYNGLTIKGATKIVLNSENQLNWYVEIAYEYTRLEEPEFGTSSSYNRDMKIFYPGIGVIWNL